MVVTSRTDSSFSLSAFLLGDAPAGFILSWVAGFVDTAAFIILFGLFTAHVTGNLALAGSSFVSADIDTTLTRLSMIPCFMLTVAATSLLARFVRSRKGPVFAVLLTAEAIALAIFLGVGVQFAPALLLDIQEEFILPIGITGVMAMAIQNALMKEAKGVFKSYIPTTVMTGNTTQLTIDIVQFLVAKVGCSGDGPNPEAEEALERMGRVFPTMLGFALGGIGAALFVPIADFWSILLPLIAIVLLATAAYIQYARQIAIAMEPKTD